MLIKHGNGKSPRNIGFSAIIIYINGEFSIAMLECQRVNNPASERWMSIRAQNLKPENTLSTRYISNISKWQMFTGTHLVVSYIRWWIPKTLGPSTKMITWMIWGAPLCKGIWKRDLLHPFHTEKQTRKHCTAIHSMFLLNNQHCY